MGILVTVNRQSEMVEHAGGAGMLAPGTIQIHMDRDDADSCITVALEPADADALGRTLRKAAREGRRQHARWVADDAS